MTVIIAPASVIGSVRHSLKIRPNGRSATAGASSSKRHAGQNALGPIQPPAYSLLSDVQKQSPRLDPGLRPLFVGAPVVLVGISLPLLDQGGARTERSISGGAEDYRRNAAAGQRHP